MKTITALPSIAEIRDATLAESPYFFTRDTLRFFGQTMRSFRVLRGRNDSIYIAAPSYWTDRETGRPKLMGYSVRRFSGADLENTTTTGGTWDGAEFRNLDQVRAFVRANG
jgi:hypothetical protein